MRLIDADALKEALAKNITVWTFNVSYDGILAEIIDNAPTAVDLPELKEAYQDGYKDGQNDRPQGEWEYNQYDGNPNIGNWHCSECRKIVSGKYNQYPNYNFCPNCGAKMGGST